MFTSGSLAFVSVYLKQTKVGLRYPVEYIFKDISRKPYEIKNLSSLCKPWPLTKFHYSVSIGTGVSVLSPVFSGSLPVVTGVCVLLSGTGVQAL